MSNNKSNVFGGGTETRQDKMKRYDAVCMQMLPLLKEAVIDPEAEEARIFIRVLLKQAEIETVTNLDSLKFGADFDMIESFLRIQASGFAEPQTLDLCGDVQRLGDAVTLLLTKRVYAHYWQHCDLFSGEEECYAAKTVKGTRYESLVIEQ